jgi:hypothetical protein
MNLVISQSMFFPWVGFLQLINASDTYVIYDDVPFSKGSFTNRIQIKTASGKKWLTIPVGRQANKDINQIALSPDPEWTKKIQSQFSSNYSRTPYFDDAMSILVEVIEGAHQSLGDLACASTMRLLDYLQIRDEIKVVDIRELSTSGNGSERVLEVAKSLGAEVYLSAMGGKNYLKHNEFDRENIEVRYADYQIDEWPQLHGAFDPFVSSLDLIAHCGPNSRERLTLRSKSWKEVVNGCD